MNHFCLYSIYNGGSYLNKKCVHKKCLIMFKSLRNSYKNINLIKGLDGNVVTYLGIKSPTSSCFIPCTFQYTFNDRLFLSAYMTTPLARLLQHCLQY